MIAVAVVGLGWWGQHLLRILDDPDAPVRVVATVDPNEEHAADHRSLEEALGRDDVDAVVLCTPHSTHPAQIHLAAAAGKHVFCEKPLALTTDEAVSAVGACAKRGLVLGVGHERRFEPAMAAIRDLVVSGSLGVIMHVEAAFSHDKFVGLDASSWRGSAEDAPAAGMTGMGIHLTDAMIWMFGAIDEVHAYVGRRVLPLASGDVISVQLRFVSGATASFSAVSATPFYAKFSVFGSEGWVESREKQHPEAGTETAMTLVRRGRDQVRWEFSRTDAVLTNLEAFAAAVERKTPYPFTEFEMVHNIAVLEAIVRSSSTGRAARVQVH